MSKQAEGRMTPERLAEIRERVNAATAGPWSWMVQAFSGGRGSLFEEKTSPAKCPYPKPLERAEDYKFVAAARSDVPALIAALEAAWEDAAELRERVNELETLLAKAPLTW